QGQELGRLRARAEASGLQAERFRAIGGERRDEGLARGVELAQARLGRRRVLSRRLEQAFDEPRRPLERPADEGQVELVDVEPPRREAGAPSGVQAVAERL